MEGIRGARDHGLLPEDYHLVELERRGLVSLYPDDPDDAAEGEFLLSDALVRLSFHLRFGKVDPVELDGDWNFSREMDHMAPADAIREALESGDLPARFRQLWPDHPAYRRLMDGLAQYRAILANGGWITVSEGPTLKPGMTDPRVEALRMRLAAEGDLAGARDLNGEPPPEGSSDPRFFGPDVEEAVRAFQHRYGLAEDGAVGDETLSALRIPVADRIDQIRVNLERGRWLLKDVGSSYIAANIAAFQVHIIENDTIVWTTRAQVGHTYRKTPLFRADMAYLVFNPNWIVPPTILAQDVLPAVRADPAYLGQKRMRVIDRSGAEVDPSTIDWQAYSGPDFPYLIRQDPGPTNSLGQVKFIFPNTHLVFMHDTPSRELFDRSVRTFSSGCIRLEDPLDFATYLLGGQEGWDRVAVEAAIGSGETRTVHLEHPIPVLLLYWTASGDRDGHMHFNRDIYDRDPAILRRLNGEFRMWRSLQQGR
jgi:murein L,D-transpeptidase YcbB/YkuD